MKSRISLGQLSFIILLAFICPFIFLYVFAKSNVLLKVSSSINATFSSQNLQNVRLNQLGNMERFKTPIVEDVDFFPPFFCESRNDHNAHARVIEIEILFLSSPSSCSTSTSFALDALLYTYLICYTVIKCVCVCFSVR